MRRRMQQGLNRIYIIGNSTAIKIGFSADPESRVKQLQTANQHKLELLWSMERNDAVHLEKHLHRVFRKYKMQGEWFNSELTTTRIIAECYSYTKYDW